MLVAVPCIHFDPGLPDDRFEPESAVVLWILYRNLDTC